MTRRTLITILVSLLFHAALLFWLTYRAYNPATPGVRGTVSVDFVERVDHPAGDLPVAVGKALGAAPKAAASASAVATTAAVGASLAGEGSAFLGEVTRLLQIAKIYPAAAIDREEEGKVVVGVTLARNGEVQGATIETPSSFSSLNQAALATVKSVARFPSVPEGLPAPLHLHVPLVFKIERR